MSPNSSRPEHWDARRESFASWCTDRFAPRYTDLRDPKALQESREREAVKEPEYP